MKKIRQFDIILETRPLGATATKDGIRLGIITETGKPTNKAFIVNNMAIVSQFAGKIPEKALHDICLIDRLRVAITCYFIALQDIEKVSMAPIIKEVQFIFKSFHANLAETFIRKTIIHVENILMQDEHYEDHAYWMPVKDVIINEMQKQKNETV